MEKLIVSACLLGYCCRYNGKCGENLTDRLKDKYELIPVCPEVLGGLPTPRSPAEIADGRVVNCEGNDVTEEYRAGARKTLEIAMENGCRKALMKERSPSCGFGTVYDGSFSGKLVCGNGVAADLLQKNSVSVFGESRIEELL